MKRTLFGFLAFSILLLLEAPIANAKVVVRSDNTWKVTKNLYPEWEELGYDDSSWDTTVAPTQGKCSYYERKAFFSDPMWHPLPREHERIFLRKEFIIDGDVKQAVVRARFDDDGEVYLNGELIGKDKSGRTEKNPLEIDATSYLKSGTNLIALMAADSYGGCQWAMAEIDVEFDSGVVLDIPELKQTDSNWSNITYDHGDKQALFCGKTVSECGCALTSLAMILKYYGVNKSPNGNETNPESLNDYFNGNAKCLNDECITKGYVFGNVRWNAASLFSKEAHDRHSTPKIQLEGFYEFSMDNVRKKINQSKPVILKAQTFSHWFVARGYTESTILVNDPLFTIAYLSNKKYQNTAAKMVVYEKVNSDFSSIEVFTKAPEHILVTDIFGRRSGYESAKSKAVLEIPRSSYIYQEDINSTAAQSFGKGIQWLIIRKPADGVYFIGSTGTGPIAIYVSDKDANEIYKITNLQSEIHFSKEDVSKSSILETKENKCLCRGCRT